MKKRTSALILAATLASGLYLGLDIEKLKKTSIGTAPQTTDQYKPIKIIDAAEIMKRLQNHHQNESLSHAIYLGDIEGIKTALQNGADINAPFNDMPPLLNAAAGNTKNAAEVTKFLLDHGANIQGTDKYGNTALHKAVFMDRPEIVKTLLERNNLPVDAKNKKGETALMIAAAEEGNTSVATLLLSAGADVNAIDKKGETALMKAARTGHRDMIKFLCHHGANPNMADKNGYTASRHAAYNGRPQIVQEIADIQSPKNSNAWFPSGDKVLSRIYGLKWLIK